MFEQPDVVSMIGGYDTVKSLFRVIRNFRTPEQCEKLIAQTFRFKELFYNEQNLATHTAYLADKQPHRTSHAYAMAGATPENLPGMNLHDLIVAFPEMADLFEVAVAVSYDPTYLGLSSYSRTLFNVQEYYGGSERVPKHCDGELLEFSADQEGNLDIKRSIRPNEVAVLTLVNDTDGGGTRVHLPNGDEQVVQCQAGDMVIFNNVVCFHSVDALKGEVKRPDGLLRMTIGWRSLGDKTHFMQGEDIRPISMKEANAITENWYKTEWPQQWSRIKEAAQKAAF